MMKHSPSVDVNTLEDPLDVLCVLDKAEQKLEKLKELNKKLKEQQLPIMNVDALTKDRLTALAAVDMVEQTLKKCFALVGDRKELGEQLKKPTSSTITADVPTEPYLDALYVVDTTEKGFLPMLDTMEKQLEEFIADDARIKDRKAMRQLIKAREMEQRKISVKVMSSANALTVAVLAILAYLALQLILRSLDLI